MPSNRIESSQRRATLLGLAFDADDGHKRITRGPDFFLAGGSEGTHGRMRDTVVKVSEELAQRGQDLADVSPGELREIFREVLEE